ncbi:MAG: hypothetical protein A4E42_01759 [Methanoregulaceae archaeon PtaU1.Bin222]|nr:MAG: hypothetical protein A4E42_01759 [Methanoregulaceae archaeon PtaU1.Bin222]
MEHIDSAISDALYYQRSGSLSVPLPLGGGDIMFNNVRSGGVLRVREEPMMNMTFINSSSSSTFPLTISSITYTPVSNFWVPQGYSWQFGSLNVTKGDLTTPLRLSTGDETEIDQFSEALFTLSGNNGDLEITCAGIRPGMRNTTSGNGIASLNLNADKSTFPTISGVSRITINITSELPATFGDHLRNYVNDSIKDPPTNEWENDPSGNITYTYPLNQPNLTITKLNLILSVE